MIDVFSQFLWLSPLQKKAGSHVVRPPTRIYSEHDPPDGIQSDRGRMQGNVMVPLIARSSKSKLSRRPYHPQSHGKEERSHRRLRKYILRLDDVLQQRSKLGGKYVVLQPHIKRSRKQRETGEWKSPFEHRTMAENLTY